MSPYRARRPALDLLSHGAASDRPLDDLTAAQRAAATHATPLLVLGAAGTGKTRIVEARFRWLVGEGCDPERIAVLVPSGARAAALRARIETRLERGYEQLFVLDPARLAAHVLRSAAAGAGRPAGVGAERR